MQLMSGAMKAAKPDLPKPEKDMSSLESETVFKKELEYAGFSNIAIHLITHDIELKSPKSFWNEMTKGSAPIAMLRKNTDDKTWLSMEKTALDYIKNSIANFPTTLSSDAWIGVADKETAI